jgi:glucose/arabinose dehydrogenase
MTCRIALGVLALLLTLAAGVGTAQVPPGSSRTDAAAASKPPVLAEGHPVDSRPPEKADDKPDFPEQTRAPYHATKPYAINTLVEGITAPWGMAFLPGGNMLITERLPGKMRLLRADGRLSAPLDGVAGLRSPDAADIGLLDVVLDPAFATTHRVFFTFYDYVGGTNSNTAVARARLDENAPALTDVTVIFRAQPRIPSKRLGGKTGGRMVFGADGNLFLTIGDRSDSPPWDVAQRMDTHLGKVLRITPDGAAPPDNPFVGKPGVLPEIWASGSRNAEGLALDPRTGRLWANEHGPRGGDELNIIEKGANYGWPLAVHGIDYPGKPIGEGITHKDGMTDPIYYWDPVIAPSGLAFYTGTLFPDWKDSLFVGGLRSLSLVRLKIVKDKAVEEEPLLTELHSRIRDVRVGPDGAVYVLTDSGGSAVTANTPPTSQLLKLTPK